jgi:hypothetical protein
MAADAQESPVAPAAESDRPPVVEGTDRQDRPGVVPSDPGFRPATGTGPDEPDPVEQAQPDVIVEVAPPREDAPETDQPSEVITEVAPEVIPEVAPEVGPTETEPERPYEPSEVITEVAPEIQPSETEPTQKPKDPSEVITEIAPEVAPER